MRTNNYEYSSRKQNHLLIILSTILIFRFPFLKCQAQGINNSTVDSLPASPEPVTIPVATDPWDHKNQADSSSYPETRLFPDDRTPPNIYETPYSMTGSVPDWHRLWINTATLTGAFVGTLSVLECLPEDATSWNRAELQDVPLFKRWHKHVIEKGPEWDHDRFYFNYILHPYAGAVYFMAARSCGFNMWQSLLYSSLISNVGWEFGIEAFMERPSIQDLIITPLVGSAIGECFYRIKRSIVNQNYCLGGSKVLGNIICFLIDPVNEAVGLFTGNPCRSGVSKGMEMSSSFVMSAPSGCRFGLCLTCRF